MAFVVPKLALITEHLSLFTVLRENAPAISKIISKLTFVVYHILRTCLTDLSRLGLLDIDWSLLPVLALSMSLAHLHFTFVLLTIGKHHHCTFGRHWIIHKRAKVSASIWKNHLAKALEIVVIEFTYVKDAICDSCKPVGTTPLHLVVLKEAVIQVWCLEHARAPACSLAFGKFSHVLHPELLALWEASFALGFGLFNGHSDYLEHVL